jgi:hypothetical protein
MTLNRKDFTVKSEDFSRKRKGKREYLNDSETHDLVSDLNQYFQSKVKVPRVRMGERQEIETLINEEAFASFDVSEKREAVLDSQNCELR